MTIRPKPARSARISITPSVAARARTETAIAENDSNAPLIQSTTRTMFCGRCFFPRRRRSGLDQGRRALTCITSFGVGLVLRPGLLEGSEFRARRIDRDDFGKSIEWHLQAPRVVDLRHQADVGEGDLAAEGIGRRAEHRFQWLEAVENPVVVPGVDLGLVLTQLVFEIAQRARIVERMDV